MMEYTAAVITVSDKGSRGEREDTSGPALAGLLTQVPLASLGLGWVVPAAVGTAVGILLSLVTGGGRTRLE